MKDKMQALSLLKVSRLEKLREYTCPKSDFCATLTPWPFSCKRFRFQPTRGDWKLIRKYVPTINLFLTNRCNSFCRICFKSSSPFEGLEEDFTLDEIAQILRRIGSGKRIVLMGGEPTVRQDLFEIIDLIKEKKDFVELYTNGLVLANSRFVKELKSHGIDRIIMSFDGFNPRIYAEMRGGEHELFLKMLALRNLAREGILTFLSATIARGINDNEVEKLLRFVMRCVKEKRSIRGILFYAATRFGRYLIDRDMEVLELVRRLEGTNLGIRIEYFAEMKKFLLNSFRIFSKLGLLLPVGSMGLIAIYRVGSLKEWIPLPELIKINELFKRNKLKALLKAAKTIKPLKPFRNFYRILLNSNLMVIGVGGLHTPDNFLPYLSDTIGIEKDRLSGIPFVNAFNYTLPAGEIL
jgi:uncharacterized Fe-S cluster-containing radical SAM superfamily protein